MALRADVERFSPVTEAAILNGICCPPQDPFKLSAQEPLLKAQKEEGDEVQRPKECWRASLAIVLCRGFMSSEFESELQERTKVGSFGHHLLYLDRRSFLTISIKYIYWLSHETLLDFYYLLPWSCTNQYVIIITEKHGELSPGCSSHLCRVF